jgi:hypothetical protein
MTDCTKDALHRTVFGTKFRILQRLNSGME